MARRTPAEVIGILRGLGIAPGVTVTWQPAIVGINPRFGCVMAIDGERGLVEVQASNARISLPAASLTACPDVWDAVAADQRGIYAN